MRDDTETEWIIGDTRANVVGTGAAWASFVGPLRPTREEAAADRRRMVEALEGADELAELRAKVAALTNEVGHWKRVAAERASGGLLRRLAHRLLHPERVR